MNRPTFIFATHHPTATAYSPSVAAGYAAANILEGTEDTAWKPADTSGSKYIEVLFGGLLPIGQIAILGQYLNGVMLEVRGSTDGFVSSNVQLSAPSVIGSSEFVTAYRRFTESLYSEIVLIFTGFAASFEIQHVACCPAVSLPFLDDGFDQDSFTPSGDHLIGVAGTYLGATQRNTMRNLALDFGQIVNAQYPPFQLWAEYCVMTMRPFFFVPNIDAPECYFGWADAKYKFSAPMKNGARKLAPIPFVGRIA